MIVVGALLCQLFGIHCKILDIEVDKWELIKRLTFLPF